MKPATTKGLKKMRNSRESKPAHHCKNCKCDRYSPCYCTKKAEKEEEENK